MEDWVLPEVVRLLGQPDEGRWEARGGVGGFGVGHQVAEAVGAVAGADGGVRAVEAIIIRSSQWELRSHHHLEQTGISGFVEGKKTHNSGDKSRQPEPEQGFLLEPPELAELGEHGVVVNILEGERGETSCLDARHIRTDLQPGFLWG